MPRKMVVGFVPALKKKFVKDKRVPPSPPPLSSSCWVSESVTSFGSCPTVCTPLRKHQTRNVRNVRNQSRAVGTGSSLAAWRRPEGVAPPRSPSSQAVCWPAAPPDFPIFRGSLVDWSCPGHRCLCPGRGSLAWRLEADSS